MVPPVERKEEANGEARNKVQKKAAPDARDLASGADGLTATCPLESAKTATVVDKSVVTDKRGGITTPSKPGAYVPNRSTSSEMDEPRSTTSESPTSPDVRSLALPNRTNIFRRSCNPSEQPALEYTGKEDRRIPRAHAFYEAEAFTAHRNYKAEQERDIRSTNREQDSSDDECPNYIPSNGTTD